MSIRLLSTGGSYPCKPAQSSFLIFQSLLRFSFQNYIKQSSFRQWRCASQHINSFLVESFEKWDARHYFVVVVVVVERYTTAAVRENAECRRNIEKEKPESGKRSQK